MMMGQELFLRDFHNRFAFYQRLLKIIPGNAIVSIPFINEQNKR